MGEKVTRMKADADFDGAADVVHRAVADELAGFVDRAMEVRARIDDFREDERQVYAEAKGRGYDPAAIRRVVRIRRMTEAQRAAHDALSGTAQFYLDLVEGGGDG